MMEAAMSYLTGTYRIASYLVGPMVLILLTALSACEEASRGPVAQNPAGLDNFNPNAEYFIGSDPVFSGSESGSGP
jgi:hypothetical protein